MLFSLRTCVSIASALAFSRLVYAAEPAGCPDRITVEERLAKPIAGWSTMLDDYPHKLESITFFDGPPEEKASLVYDKIEKVAGKQVATWTFDPKGPRPLWITCSYSATNVLLKKSLTPKPAQCSVTYDGPKTPSGLPAVQKMVCK